MNRPLRVLLVLGSEGDAEPLLLELRRGGFDPSHERVEDARQLRDALRRGPWDVALADYAPPAFSAAEALRLLRRAGSGVPLLVVCGPVGEEAAARLARAGARAVLPRGEPGRLAAAVARVLRGPERAGGPRRRFRRLLRRGVAAGCWTAEGGVTAGNDALLRLLGRSRAELEAGAVRWRDATPPEYRHLDEKALAQARATGCWVPFRKEYVRGDGSRVPVLVCGAAAAAGDAGVFFAVELTGRSRAEEPRGDELLRLQVERMPLAYLLLDADLRVADWNPAAERTFGYSKEEALGMGPPYAKILPPALWPRVEAVLARLRGGDMAAHSVNDNLTKDGRTVTCQWFNTPLLGPGGRFGGLLCLGQDITERRRLEERLGQAQKMEALGRLAGGVAHDFNNLLTVISGYCEVLLDGLPEGDALRGPAEEIRGAAERSAALARQLLDFGRGGGGDPGVADLNGVVAGARGLLLRLVGPGVRVEERTGPGPCPVRADAGELGRVLLNLAANARDAMPRGGTLTVRTGDAGPAEGAGPQVLLEVSDTGCGMTEEVKARAFEPYFTTKGPGGGTGLGLAVVHGVVARAGGRVEVESAPGAGTTVRVYLPRAR